MAILSFEGLKKIHSYIRLATRDFDLVRVAHDIETIYIF